MGTTLEGKKPGGADATFRWLLHTGNATLASPRRVSTGDGLDTGLVVGADSIGVANAGGHVLTFDASALTVGRSVVWRDLAGTVAFLDDIPNTSEGGNGVADAGKAALFSEDGDLTADAMWAGSFRTPAGASQMVLAPGSLTFSASGGMVVGSLLPPASGGANAATLPSGVGTLALSSETLNLTGDQSAAGVKTFSGRLNGSAGITSGTDYVSLPGGVTAAGVSLAAFNANFVVVGGSNTTNATRKFTRWAGAHFTNAEEPLVMMIGDSISANTADLYFGGGTGIGNAFQNLRFYTAATSTTLTGTERMRIDAAGNVGIGTAAPGFLLDVAGSFRATGQVELTGQAAVNASSAMTRKLVDRRILERATQYTIIDVPTGWTSNAAVNGSTASVSARTLFMVASDTLNSEAYTRTSGFQPHHYSYNGEETAGGNAGIWWDKETYFGFRARVTHGVNSSPTAAMEGYVRFGLLRSYATYGPLNGKGIGVKFAAGSIYPMVHDGTTLNLGVTPIYTTTSALGPVNQIEIVGNGAGSFGFYVNGALQATLTGGPTGYGGQENTATNVMCKNVTGGVNTGSSISIANAQFIFGYLN